MTKESLIKKLAKSISIGEQLTAKQKEANILNSVYQTLISTKIYSITF